MKNKGESDCNSVNTVFSLGGGHAQTVHLTPSPVEPLSLHGAERRARTAVRRSPGETECSSCARPVTFIVSLSDNDYTITERAGVFNGSKGAKRVQQGSSLNFAIYFRVIVAKRKQDIAEFTKTVYKFTVK